VSRLKTTFSRLRSTGKTGLIPYVTAGDPSRESVVALMHVLVSQGADVLELGVPFFPKTPKPLRLEILIIKFVKNNKRENQYYFYNLLYSINLTNEIRRCHPHCISRRRRLRINERR